MKATHQAVVVPIVIEPHPNADLLGIVKVDDSIVVVNKEQWAGKDRGVYIPPQNAVDTERPEFSFLKKTERRWVEVKPVKLRGVYSNGLLIPTDAPVGTDMTLELDIQHVDHEVDNSALGVSSERHIFSGVSKYDIDSVKNFRRYIDGLRVAVTEKIHGENCGVGFIDGKLRVRSRSNWLSGSNHFIDTVAKYENIIQLCKDMPDHIVYGEVYGKAKKGSVRFRYGLPETQPRGFIPFDIRKPDMSFMGYVEFSEIMKKYDIVAVPEIFNGIFCEGVYDIASGQSCLDSHIREGIVVRPLVECQTDKFERIIFKVVSPEYSAL